jgi:uncharacterized membrane protein
MGQFLAGLVLFFGIHSVSIFALPLRDRLAAKNKLAWRGLYSLVSLAGIVMVARGYAELRLEPTMLYIAPIWLRHVSAVMMIPVFMLFLAPYFPGQIRNRVKNPQLVAVKTWAAAHLLVNGTLADLLLFGCFLVWAVAGSNSMKNRPDRPVPGAPVSPVNDVIVVVGGMVIYAAFVFGFHQFLIGVPPF